MARGLPSSVQRLARRVGDVEPEQAAREARRLADQARALGDVPTANALGFVADVIDRDRSTVEAPGMLARLVEVRWPERAHLDAAP